MIAPSDIQEYRKQCLHRRKRAAQQVAWRNDPDHPERRVNHAKRECARYHGKKPSEIYYDPLARKIRNMSARARRKTPEYREKRKMAVRAKHAARMAAAAATGDTTYCRQRLLKAAFYRARKKGVPFSITLDDVQIPERCPVLGMLLNPHVTVSGGQDDSPSIDRIIPALGYVPGNILVISKRANTVKGDATVREMEQVLEFYKDRLPG